ncbi:MAG: ABC transporter ATP-binding protein [Lachnospiraceae bacterium]|nr:ABC transporter ATP-binding protein [Lachnospiraceae bacterium]
MDVIEINNLTKKYGNIVAVDSISLNIEKGKIYGFLGPNGAGKTTTLNIITGYIGASEGTVKINGFDVLKDADEAKKQFGYLPELPPLYMDMTVAEYLKFAAELKKIDKKDRKKSIDEAMKLAGVDKVSKRLIKNLSKGYKQRVGVSQAILGMPEVIILDEPSVGLDPGQIKELRSLIKKLGEKHTVILSSHILSEISEVCEQIFIISKGKIVANCSKEELLGNVSSVSELELEVKGNEKHVVYTLNNIEGIGTFKTMMMGDTVNIKINMKSDNDIRETLFNALSEAKIPILSMKLNEQSLEDVFMELTKDNDPSESASGTKSSKNEKKNHGKSKKDSSNNNGKEKK